MLARPRNTAIRPACLLLLFTLAGLLAPLVGQTGRTLGQQAAVAGHPVAAALLEGAPPDPDAILISPDIEAVLDRDYPRSIEDLRVIERQVARVLQKVVPATVGIQIGPSAGSGVIISPDGLVLTAGHVSGEPGRNAFLIMPDGRRVRGRTLGLNRRIDSGLMRIVEKGPWPYVDMAQSSGLENGQWVIATGHPGGFDSDRSPPVRLGRILYANEEVICTDCTLVGGDSGGPLFNMKGEVIGIHSRIGRSVTSNFHVPIATYHDTWDRLAAGEVWGGRMPTDERGQVRPFLGVNLHGMSERATVTQVAPGTPAARAGVQVNDVIVKFAGVEVADQDALIHELWATRPGQRVEMEVQRGEETLTLRIVVGGSAQALPGSPEYEPREPRREDEHPEQDESPEAEPGDDDPMDDGEPMEEPKDEQPKSGGESDPTPGEGGESPAPEDAKPKGQSGDGGEQAEPPKSGSDKESPSEGAKEEPAAEKAPVARDPQEAAERLLALGIELDPVALRCVVSRVVAESPAEAAGLRAGDVILSIGEKKTQEVADLADLPEWKEAATEGIAMSIDRNGREVRLVLQLGD
jgi:serine protease Do